MSVILDIDKQNNTAREVVEKYGHDGLLSLWLLQGFYDEMDSPPEHQTPGVFWWLHPDNSYAKIIQEFCATLDATQAYALLSQASRKPKVDFEVVYDMNDRGSELYLPSLNEFQDWSELDVKSVRKLVMTFFPHLPELASPLYPLYVEKFEYVAVDDMTDEPVYIQRYHEIMDGFSHDVHAMKYFTVLGYDLPKNPPKWLVEFKQNKDAEWNIYDGIGFTSEQAYLMASTRQIGSDKHMLAMPGKPFDFETLSVEEFNKTS